MALWCHGAAVNYIMVWVIIPLLQCHSVMVNYTKGENYTTATVNYTMIGKLYHCHSAAVNYTMVGKLYHCRSELYHSEEIILLPLATIHSMGDNREIEV